MRLKSQPLIFPSRNRTETRSFTRQFLAHAVPLVCGWRIECRYDREYVSIVVKHAATVYWAFRGRLPIEDTPAESPGDSTDRRIDGLQELLLPFRAFREICLLAFEVARGPVVCGFDHDDGMLVAQRKVVQTVAQPRDFALREGIEGEAYDIEGNVPGDEGIEEPGGDVVVVAAIDVDHDKGLSR